MTKFDLMDQLLKQNNGVIRTADIVAAGVSKTYFAEYIKSRKLEKISHGIYTSADAWPDTMYFFQLRYQQAIFSHDAALYLHDMTDREPLQLTITVKTGYNTSIFQKQSVKAYTVNKDLHKLGLTTAKTPFNNTVKVYNPERTVCDIVRSRSEIEMQTYQSALSQFVKRKDKNLHLLMEYAKAFKVEKILRQYLEVMLP